MSRKQQQGKHFKFFGNYLIINKKFKMANSIIKAVHFEHQNRLVFTKM